LRPEEPFAYLYLGETYSETKRLPQAIETLEKYLRVVPNPEEIPRDVSRAYYLLGQTCAVSAASRKRKRRSRIRSVIAKQVSL